MRVNNTDIILMVDNNGVIIWQTIHSLKYASLFCLHKFLSISLYEDILNLTNVSMCTFEPTRAKFGTKSPNQEASFLLTTQFGEILTLIYFKKTYMRFIAENLTRFSMCLHENIYIHLYSIVYGCMVIMVRRDSIYNNFQTKRISALKIFKN